MNKCGKKREARRNRTAHPGEMRVDQLSAVLSTERVKVAQRCQSVGNQDLAERALRRVESHEEARHCLLCLLGG